MGAEFLRRTKPTIEKYVDRKRTELAIGDLFSRIPSKTARTALVSVNSAYALCAGDQVIVEAVKNELVVTRNGCVIGNFTNPPEELILSIASSCGT